MSNILRFFYLILLVIILLFGPASIARADAPNKPGGTDCHSGYLTMHNIATKNIVVKGIFYLNDVAASGGESFKYLLSAPDQAYVLKLPANIPGPGTQGSPFVNGNCVRITGTLVTVSGVEGPNRTVIKVTSAESAK
jgi:hypothetical protein